MAIKDIAKDLPGMLFKNEYDAAARTITSLSNNEFCELHNSLQFKVAAAKELLWFAENARSSHQN